MVTAAHWAAYLRLSPPWTPLSHPCDKMGTMTEDPDFRSDKSESVEGRGNAGARWDAYHLHLDEAVLAEAFPSPTPRVEDYDELVRDDIAAAAVEDSELIGFWVAWHLAGGFHALESGGWHRVNDLPQGPPLPFPLRRPPRRVRLPLDHPRPREGLGCRYRQPHRVRTAATTPTDLPVSHPGARPDQLVANSPVGPLRELASGVDALYLSGRAELPKRFLARLEDCRTWAAEAGDPLRARSANSSSASPPMAGASTASASTTRWPASASPPAATSRP